ncbi:MAG TPA: DEAD/DEAH box helicase [Sedimentisphaerales bacterium]|nr:DEAD/DEAH box helicase [Sedimentisphaerales bacterium]
MVWEQGHLAKSNIMEIWDLREDQYPELQRRVLASDRRIQKGPKRTGGFNIHDQRGRSSPEHSDERVLLRTEWERQSVERLTELLTRDQIEALLGDLRFPVRRLRSREIGKDSATKTGLAAALVLQHGVDLFCDPEIRKHIATACRVNYPKRWHPGKGAAAEFVARTGFPRELVGIPAPEALCDYEYLEGRFDLKELKPFQKDVKEQLDRVLENRGQRAIVTLPTGAGKTRVAVESIRDVLTKRYDVVGQTAAEAAVLWLAHTEELCEQACECFHQVWINSKNVCPLLLVRFWGRYTQDLIKHGSTLQEIVGRPTVLISTPQRIANLLDDRVEGGAPVLQGLRESLSVLLIDEAHRAAAPMYRRILRDLLPSERHVSVAGLTATPFRMEYFNDDPEGGTRDLRDIFGELIEPIRTLGDDPSERLEQLRQMGILARPDPRLIHTRTIMRIPDVFPDDEVDEEDIERVDRIMASRADNLDRRLMILEHLLPLGKDSGNSILYFGPSVRDAEHMAFLLRREQVPAAVLTGKTRDVTRRQTVAEFKRGEIRVLCNCQVLTTGFDAPRVTHIVVARPTVSGVLYEQMIGRGLRGPEFGGTKSCVILDCEDEFRGPRPRLGYESLRQVWTRRPIRAEMCIP